MNAKYTSEFMKRSQTDPRFAKLKMLSCEGNILGVTGEIDSQASYDAFIELGRLCGFIVLCDALTVKELCDASRSAAAAAKRTGSSRRDPMSIFHLLPQPPEQDHLGGYTYHCGGCITSFFNEEGHRQIKRHGAWCKHCGGELVLVWKPGDPV